MKVMKDDLIKELISLGYKEESESKLKRRNIDSLTKLIEKVKEEKKMSKPSYIPAINPKHILGNTDAKIWASKKVKTDNGFVLKFHAIGNDKEGCGQLMARLYDQGFTPEFEGQLEEIDDVRLCSIYMIPEEDNKKFRAAFRLCKTPGKYNDKVLAEEKIKKKKVQAAAKAKLKKAKKAEEKKDAPKPKLANHPDTAPKANDKVKKPDAPKSDTKDEAFDKAFDEVK